MQQQRTYEDLRRLECICIEEKAEKTDSRVCFHALRTRMFLEFSGNERPQAIYCATTTGRIPCLICKDEITTGRDHSRSSCVVQVFAMAD